MHYYITLIGLLLLSCQVFGTCVVVIRTPNEIIVGADSRRISGKADGTFSGEFTDDNCKIRQAGKFFYCLVGYSDVKQIEFANSAADSAKNIHDFAAIFSNLIGPYYAGNLEWMREHKPDNYINGFTGTHDVFTEMPFFAFENGSPQVIVVRFRNVTKEGEKVQIRPQVIYNEPIFVLGSKSAFFKAYPTFESLNEEMKKIGFVDLTKKIISIESEDNPKMVGGPVYILRLTSNKKEWVDGKEPKC